MNTNIGNYDVSKFDKPSVSIDVLIFTIIDEHLKIVLIKRGVWPFEGKWAIPGGFVKMNESLEDAAVRELSEETGVKNVYLEQLYTFGDPKRDPRTRVITVSYIALIPFEKLHLHASTDASDVSLYSVNSLPPLAFDHKKIVTYALNRLRTKIQYSNIVYGLMPEKFRLSHLQKVYETILGEQLDKRNFRKRLFALELVEKTGEKEIEGAHRPAMLFRFKERRPIFFD